RARPAPGVLAWTLNYGNVGAMPTSGPGMLLSVSRPTLTQGSVTTVNGTANTTIVYDVPTVTAQNGPYAMGGSDVAAWGQQAVPTLGTAVFPPDSVPSGNVGRGGLT